MRTGTWCAVLGCDSECVNTSWQQNINMGISPIDQLLRHNVPHIWVKILGHLDGDSFEAFRSTCFDFYQISESALQDNNQGLKTRLHFEMTQFITTPMHLLPQIPNSLSLRTKVTTFAQDDNDVFLGLMTGDSNGGFVYHLDLTSNQCLSCSHRFRGPIISIQCMSDKIVIVYEEKFNPNYGYTDRKYALYQRYPELKPIPVKMPYLTCTSRLSVVGDVFMFFQSLSENGGILANRLESNTFQPVMEFPGDQDRLTRLTQTKTHVLFSASRTLSMVRFHRSSHEPLWTTTLSSGKAKINTAMLSDELVVVERVYFLGNFKNHLIVSFRTGEVIREYNHAQMGDWVHANKRILKGTFELVTFSKNSKPTLALFNWATQEVIPMPTTNMSTWEVLENGIRISLSDGRILWICRSQTNVRREFHLSQRLKPIHFDTQVLQLVDQGHLAFVPCLAQKSGVTIVKKLTKAYLE